MLATQTRFGGIQDESEKTGDKMTRCLIMGCGIDNNISVRIGFHFSLKYCVKIDSRIQNEKQKIAHYQY